MPTRVMSVDVCRVPLRTQFLQVHNWSGKIFQLYFYFVNSIKSNHPDLDAAIIDLDGTMVDTLGDFAEALNRMLSDLALPAIAAPAIEQMVGKGSEHLLRSVLNHVLINAGKAPTAIEIEALYVRAWPSYQRHYRKSVV